jgi:tRNA(Ile2) C34 agmatinyltransferase TiaS
MITTHTVVRLLFGSALLCLGLTNVAQAEHAPGPSDVMKTDSVTNRQGFQSDDDKLQHVDAGPKGAAAATKTINGELFRIKDGHYFVKLKDGSELRLHADKTTKMVGKIAKGDQVEATVNDKDHALSIHSTK